MRNGNIKKIRVHSLNHDNLCNLWRFSDLEEATYELYVRAFRDVWYAIILKKGKIFASSFSAQGRADVITHVMTHLPAGAAFMEKQLDDIASGMLYAMHRIYEGDPTSYEFELDWDHLPIFTKNALRLTASIPLGFVATYGGIALALGDKHAARAVGNVEARNPFAPIVPCHRVVDSNLHLHGYGHGLAAKRAFLEREKVSFEGNCVSAHCVWIPSMKSTNY
jgi:O-6-methylguanine DNA methyltransferase